MAGMRCPECGEFTFFKTNTGRKCTKCGYTMTTPVKDRLGGGKGRYCYNCGKYQVFNNKCRNCGAEYHS